MKKDKLLCLLKSDDDIIDEHDTKVFLNVNLFFIWTRIKMFYFILLILGILFIIVLCSNDFSLLRLLFSLGKFLLIILLIFYLVMALVNSSARSFLSAVLS